MPKRSDLRTILIIGAGPIVIGQACEFDYSGAQACKALREEGYRVVLVNSNPATIMTDPEMADVTYIEPITWSVVEKIIAKERPDAVLPTMGGQTALNCALDLHRHGVLQKYGVEMIGANEKAIDKAEDRLKFKDAMTGIGLHSARSGIAHTMDEALAVQKRITHDIGGNGFPMVIRPSFTLGGTGGGIAYNPDEFEEICKRGLDLSPTKELLIEESLIGWKEFEMEVVRDKADNCIIVCSIENLDPMGVHTGDSITVAPAQTLSDKEYQLMRNASIAILREIGVETGGSNVQFAVNPNDGRMVVIEMNPRVSRSSALASKATGFPIAKVAAKLAVGYTLDELKNDITGGATPASFEPSIDYVVTKVPRFAFEKFPAADSTPDDADEVGGRGDGDRPHLPGEPAEGAARPRDRDRRLQRAFERSRGDRAGDRRGRSGAAALPRRRLSHRHERGGDLRGDRDRPLVPRADRGDHRDGKGARRTLARKSERRRDALRQGQGLFGSTPGPPARARAKQRVRSQRHALDVRPVYKRVDTCAAEFATQTAYMYSTYDEECEAAPTDKKKIMVLGGGPNRIGQGIEFDYCCVHAALAMREDGYETIMVNCNPETVSTDYDTSDRLYFEPVTLEDVLEIVAKEKPFGVIVQYGGQTPLKLALELERAGVPIVGTSPDSIDVAEDRERFQKLLHELGLRQPPNRTARTEEQAIVLAHEIGYPLVVRPSYVLGGRAMEIVHGDKDLERYMREAVRVSEKSPVLLDRFLDDAIEVDVDCIADGSEVMIGGIMEHVEQAGIHSGDSACSLPPYSLPARLQDEMRRQTRLMAQALGVVGLMNVQFAIQGDTSGEGENAVVFVLEVNPRASRTVPFVSKATAQPLAKIAARCMVGQKLAAQPLVRGEVIPKYFSVKEAVFPFNKFPGVDPILGPEMRSTGEVMGTGRTFGEAMLKSQLGAGSHLPTQGTVCITVKNGDKARAVVVARDLHELGFQLVATKGTAAAIGEAGIPVRAVNKVKDGRPHIVDMVKGGEIQLVFTTVDETRTAIADSRHIRQAALAHRITYYTSMAGCEAAVEGMKHRDDLEVMSLQELHAELV